MKRSAELRRITPLAARSGLSRGTSLTRSPWPRSPHFAVVDGASAPVHDLRSKQQRRETGFSRSVRLDVRKRAGNGDPEQARCENCGRWLGLYAGQVQHRDARGMSGSRLANRIVNAGLLCGTPSELCHGAAEARDAEMNKRGWWLQNGQDPAQTPVTLHGERKRWLTDDGQYSTRAPQDGAA